MDENRLSASFGNNASDVGGAIRSRIEESEMEAVLKSSMGGYTKSSVREYIDKLKKQQQSIVDNFNSEMKRLLDEKEKAVQENVRLTEKLNKTDAEYKALSEAIVAHQLDSDEYSLQDIFDMKAKVAALETELISRGEELSQRDIRITQLEAAAADSAQEIERTKMSAKTYQDMLATAKNDASSQRRALAEMTAKVEEHRAQINYLNQCLSEGNVAELNGTIAELMNTLKQQEEISARKDELIESKENENSALRQQCSAITENDRNMRDALDLAMLQNEKMTAVNTALTEKLEDVLRDSVELCNAKANITVEKLVLERKLEAVRLRLSKYEAGIPDAPQEIKLELKKNKKA